MNIAFIVLLLTLLIIVFLLVVIKDCKERLYRNTVNLNAMHNLNTYLKDSIATHKNNHLELYNINCEINKNLASFETRMDNMRPYFIKQLIIELKKRL